jgi:hypothetical protein
MYACMCIRVCVHSQGRHLMRVCMHDTWAALGVGSSVLEQAHEDSVVEACMSSQQQAHAYARHTARRQGAAQQQQACHTTRCTQRHARMLTCYHLLPNMLPPTVYLLSLSHTCKRTENERELMHTRMHMKQRPCRFMLRKPQNTYTCRHVHEHSQFTHTQRGIHIILSVHFARKKKHAAIATNRQIDK